jgi:hypothetical protein
MSRDRLRAKSKADRWDTPAPEFREESVQSGLPARGGVGYHLATPSVDVAEEISGDVRDR